MGGGGREDGLKKCDGVCMRDVESVGAEKLRLRRAAKTRLGKRTMGNCVIKFNFGGSGECRRVSLFSG